MVALTWFMQVINVTCVLSLAFLAQRYRNQRDDLAALFVYTNPELFEDDDEVS